MSGINSLSRGLVSVLLVCILPFKSAIAQISSCTDEFVSDLIAGQHTDTGDITVCNDSNNLYVQYTTVDGWTITETHLAVTTGLDLIPQTGSGNPKIGHFLNKRTYTPGVLEDTFVISLTESDFNEGAELTIAAHAVVQLTDDQGNLIQQETGWGSGTDFPGRNWATYIHYTVQDNTSDDDGDAGGNLDPNDWIGTGQY